MLTKLKDLLLKAGTTPLGKAVEHAIVAGVSAGAALLVTDLLSKHGLGIDDIQAAGVLAVTTILAGLRALAKAKAS